MSYIKAKAKINLFFQITGKTSNNYHLIESLVVFCEDIYDKIYLFNADDNKTTIHNGTFSYLLDPSQQNLIDRILPFAEHEKKYECILTKNIPVGAGLGGGSSDAAQVAKHINSQDISAQLQKIGADLPICYYGKAAYCEGIGGIITPVLNIPKFYLVLVFPNNPLLTREIFEINTKSFSPKISYKPVDFFNDFHKMIEFISPLNNDLTEAACSLAPEIKSILESLSAQDQCYLARMSGSGSTCFGIFADKINAKKAELKLKIMYPDYWVGLSSIL